MAMRGAFIQVGSLRSETKIISSLVLIVLSKIAGIILRRDMEPEQVVLPTVSSLVTRQRPFEPRSHILRTPITYPYRLWAGDVVKLLRELVERIHQEIFPLDSRPAAWLRWVQLAKVDGCYPLFHPNGRIVTHPLSLLDAGVMQCGQAARLLYDGFRSCNLEVRLVYLQGHTTCEVYFEGAWRLAEASALDGGVIPRRGGEWVGAERAHLLTQESDFKPYREQMLRTCPNYPWMNETTFNAAQVWERTFSAIRGFGAKQSPGSSDDYRFGW